MEKCDSPEHVKAEVLNAAIRAGVARPETAMLRGEEAAGFIEEFNKIPPESSMTADSVLLIFGTPAPGALPMTMMILFRYDCAREHGMVPTKYIQDALARVQKGSL